MFDVTLKNMKNPCDYAEYCAMRKESHKDVIPLQMFICAVGWYFYAKDQYPDVDYTILAKQLYGEPKQEAVIVPVSEQPIVVSPKRCCGGGVVQ